MVLGGMKTAFVPPPSQLPWRARRLDSADVDSRVWLASTRNYIACAIASMVWIHLALGLSAINTGTTTTTTTKDVKSFFLSFLGFEDPT